MSCGEKYDSFSAYISLQIFAQTWAGRTSVGIETRGESIQNRSARLPMTYDVNAGTRSSRLYEQNNVMTHNHRRDLRRKVVPAVTKYGQRKDSGKSIKISSAYSIQLIYNSRWDPQ